MPPLHDIPAGSPLWLQWAIVLSLILHVGAGSFAITSGFGAVLVRKGSRAHGLLGKIFAAAMLIMAFMGATLACILHQPSNIIGGTLAFYLVVTAWAAIRRRQRGIGFTEIVAFIGALGVTGALTFLALQAGQSSGGWSSATLYVVFGVLAALLTLLDLRVILSGGVAGPQRINRHLWRMCLALFFAAGSFFLGQQKVMPIWIQGSPILFVPALAPLVLMAFWSIRVRLRSWAGRPLEMRVPGPTS